MTASTFKLQLGVPRSVDVEGQTLDRETFYSWLWELYGSRGLLGVHEGSLLSEQVAPQGEETESWTLDAAEAPRERDWVAGQEISETELYFDTPENAKQAATELRS